MMYTTAEGFYISSNDNQGYVLPISKPTRAPFCPFQNQLKARLSWCLRLSKTQGSVSPWKHTSDFAFCLMQDVRTVSPDDSLLTLRFVQVCLSIAYVAWSTKATLRRFRTSRLIFTDRRLKGSSSPFEDFRVTFHHSRIHNKNYSSPFED